MSAINQKEYLKKYLSLGSEPGKKKKRKKKPSVPSNRVKIIDDDVDTTFNEAVEEDLHGLIEDAPQIVGVIDERPLELRMSDYRDSDLWKPVGADSFAGHTGNNTNSDSAAQTNVEDHSKNVQKVTQLPSSKYSDDYSPPRKRNDRSNSRTRKSNDKDLNKSREEQRNYDASPTLTSRRREERSNRSSSETSDEGLKRHRNASPPRKGKKYHASPPRKDRKFDASPIGRNRKDAERRNREDNSSPRRDRSSEAFRQRRDSDQSPIRKNRTNDDLNRARKRTRDHDMSPIRRNRGGSDVSLERKNSDRSPARRSDLDGDMSPPRKNRKHRDASLERGNSDDSPVRRNKANDDISPPRRYARDRVLSPERRRNSGRQKNDRSLVCGNKPDNVSSPSRNKRHKDLSPDRKRRRSSDRSPVRRSKINYDISPPRRSKRDRDTSPEKRNRTSVRRNKFDDDSSPPRRNLKDYEGSRKGRNQGHDYNNQSASHGKRYNHEEPGRSSSVNSGVYGKHKSDLEYRRNRTENDGSTSGKHNFGNVHDPSPNRSRNEKREESPATKSKPASSGAPRKSRWDDETPTPSVERIHVERKSGLQRANELIEQNDFFKDIAGPSGAAVVAPIVRDRKTGKIRDFKKEEEEAAQKQEKDDAMKAKYDRWGKGLKQVEDATEKINSELHEMSKPLARYADDEDLERHLKEMERDGDPMLDYLRKKRRRHDIEAGKTFKPQFEGEFMPNRYSIRPGHRWDGVDRSNGYEKKWFEVMNSRRAQQEEAYKWSTEDM